MILDTQTAHEVLAQATATLTGTTITHHGDEFTVTRATIRRSSHGWPIALDVTIADDTHGTSILGSLPVEASPVGRATVRACSVYRSDNGRHCGQAAGESGRCEKHERSTR